MNVLLIRSGGLGDTLLTLPVAQAISDRCPDTVIDVLGNAAMRDTAGLTTLFRRFYSLDEARFAALYADTAAAVDRFFAPYDRVYAFTAADSSHFRARVLAGGAGDCRLLDPREPPGWNRHIVSHFLSILDYAPVDSPLPPLSPAGHHDHAGIVIHPGSGGERKNWPLERFIELAERLPQPVTFLLGPAEEARKTGDRLPGNTVSGLSIEAIGELLASAALYIGNDSGVSHLAGMLGTPSLVLFGPTDPAVWRPLGPRVRVLRAPGGEMEGLAVETVQLTAGSGL